MKLSVFFRRYGSALPLARLLVALLLFNQFAAASASHGLSGGIGLMPVCTTTGIKYVNAPDSDDARVPEPQTQTDHCVLCVLPPPSDVRSLVPARQFAAQHERLAGRQTELRTDLYRGFHCLSRSPPHLS
jgi:hypothetical protein